MSAAAAPLPLSSAAASLPPAEAVEYVRRGLDSFVLVDLTDGRRILGRLYCVDHFGNVVLREAEAYVSPQQRREETPAQSAKRVMGIVSVPPQFVKAVRFQRV